MPTGEELDGWMAGVARGDRHDFALLFEHFAPRIASYLMRGGASSAHAEELAQEAMIMVWRKAHSFDPGRFGVSAWIFAIARHLRIDRHRHEKDDHRAIDLGDLDFADPAPSPDERLDAQQRERRVREAMLQLPPEQMRLVQMSYFAEHSHRDIADSLGMPLGTVKSRIRQAVKTLRRALEGPTS